MSREWRDPGRSTVRYASRASRFGCDARAESNIEPASATSSVVPSVRNRIMDRRSRDAQITGRGRRVNKLYARAPRDNGHSVPDRS